MSKVAPAADDLLSPNKLKDSNDLDMVTPANIRENQTMPETVTAQKEDTPKSLESAQVQAE